MKREIPKQLEDRIINFYDNFNEKLDELETKMEKDLIELFYKLQIQSSVKQDKYSLPYLYEISKPLFLESYVNGFFEYERVFPEIVKELLNKEVHKIRFYVHIEPFSKNFFNTGLNYNFRYYIHKNNYEQN